MTRGLVVGKFYPPHLGHSYLIQTALENSDTVDVLIVDSPKYAIPAATRMAWLRDLHPTAQFHIIEDLEDDDNSKRWAAHTIEKLGYAPDIVFSSEDYGDAYAEFMGAEHVAVDKQRRVVPISGTKVRADTVSTSKHLSSVVKAALSIRIVVVGAESTGTTTLTRALARQYQAPWVPEIGRYYTESLLSSDFTWDDTDFANIARLQQQYESAIAKKAGGLIFCDTNATATTLWQKRYLGHMSEEVAAIAAKDTVSLYIITDDTIPFVQDGTRDGEHIRHAMHQWFVESILATGVPFIVVTGSREQRLAQATEFVDSQLPKLRTIEKSHIMASAKSA